MVFCLQVETWDHKKNHNTQHPTDGEKSPYSAWHLLQIKAQSKGKIVLMNQKVKSMPSYSISKELIKRASQHPNCWWQSKCQELKTTPTWLLPNTRAWFYLPVSNATRIAKSSRAIRTTPHMGRRIARYPAPQAPDGITVKEWQNQHQASTTTISAIEEA